MSLVEFYDVTPGYEQLRSKLLSVHLASTCVPSAMNANIIYGTAWYALTHAHTASGHRMCTVGKESARRRLS
jgi:hypothetical protein